MTNLKNKALACLFRARCEVDKMSDHYWSDL